MDEYRSLCAVRRRESSSSSSRRRIRRRRRRRFVPILRFAKYHLLTCVLNTKYAKRRRRWQHFIYSWNSLPREFSRKLRHAKWREQLTDQFHSTHTHVPSPAADHTVVHIKLFALDTQRLRRATVVTIFSLSFFAVSRFRHTHDSFRRVKMYRQTKWISNLNFSRLRSFRFLLFFLHQFCLEHTYLFPAIVHRFKLISFDKNEIDDDEEKKNRKNTAIAFYHCLFVSSSLLFLYCLSLLALRSET